MDDGEFLSRHFTQFTSRSRLWSACSKRQHAPRSADRPAGRDPFELVIGWKNTGLRNWADEKGQTDGIHLLDLQTHELTALAGSASNMWFPLWSPDGSHIVVLSVNEQKMLLFDVKSQKWTKLGEMQVDRPIWSWEGKYVYFASTFEGKPAFYRIRIADHKLERVAGLSTLKRLSFGGFDSWIGLAPDDSPLALRDISSYEIYGFDWDLP